MTAAAPVVRQQVEASGWAVARRLWAYLRGSRADYAVAAAVTAGNSAVMITRPWLLHVLIDDVFGRQDRSLLLPTLLGIGGLAAGLGLAAVFGHWFHTRAAEGAMSRMREDVLRQAQRMPIGDLRQRRTGDIVAHLTTDAAVVARAYLHAGSLVFAQALRLPAYLIIMSLVDWRLGLIAVAALPLHALMVTRLKGRTQAAGRRAQDALGRLSAVLTELVAGARDAKAFNRQGWAGERFGAEAHSLWRARVRVALLESLGWAAHVSYWAAYIAVWAFLANAVVDGAVAVGLLVAAGQYLSQVGGPVRNTVTDYVQLQGIVGAARRVFDFLGTPAADEAAPGDDLQVRRGQVRFERVGFSYGEGPVLDCVSFTARPGETVALVGPSVAGKSTLTTCCCGSMRPSQAASPSTGPISPPPPPNRRAAASASCSRTPPCSTARSPRTLPSAARTSRRMTYAARRSPPMRMTSSRPQSRATTPTSVSEGCDSRAGRCSGWRLRGRSPAIRASWCWTRPRPSWMPKPNGWCRPHSRGRRGAARRW